VPIVILGGPAQGTVDELCEMVAASVAAGARGITIGQARLAAPGRGGRRGAVPAVGDRPRPDRGMIGRRPRPER
jgi:hypothetical protein